MRGSTYLADTEALSGILAIDLSEVWRDESNNPSPGTVPPSDSWCYRGKERGVNLNHRTPVAALFNKNSKIPAMRTALILLTVNPELRGKIKWWWCHHI